MKIYGVTGFRHRYRYCHYLDKILFMNAKIGNRDKTMKIIADIHTDFPTKFGIPRQSGLVEELKGTIVFREEYRDREAFRGLEDFSHIWILWEFSENVGKEWSPTVRPPKLGGNTRMGVFATRSPFRPNPLGLSCVRLEEIEYTNGYGPVLHVSGADLMDGTHIFDIKPYLPYVDSKPDATGGFTENLNNTKMKVEITEELLKVFPKEKRKALIEILEQDPRPAYQNNPHRIYGFQFSEWEVKFKVEDDILTVIELE